MHLVVAILWLVLGVLLSHLEAVPVFPGCCEQTTERPIKGCPEVKETKRVFTDTYNDPWWSNCDDEDSPMCSGDWIICQMDPMCRSIFF